MRPERGWRRCRRRARRWPIHARRRWLLAVDMLASLYGRPDGPGSAGRGLGVEVDLDLGVGEALVQIRAPALDVVLFREGAQLLLVTSDEDRVRQDRLAVGQHDPTLFPDGEQGALEVLAGTHPPCDPVHYDCDVPHHNLTTPFPGERVCRRRNPLSAREAARRLRGRRDSPGRVPLLALASTLRRTRTSNSRRHKDRCARTTCRGRA